MQRILVIGVSGAGKSTLARALAARLELPFVPTDGLYWGPNWQLVPNDTLREQMIALTYAPSWVMDGNFDDLREIVWARADTIVWLEYPLHFTLLRLVKRNLGWFLTQRPTWSGNRMTLPQALSGIRHGFRSFESKRQTYPELLRACEHAQVWRFRRPSEAKRWLGSLK